MNGSLLFIYTKITNRKTGPVSGFLFSLRLFDFFFVWLFLKKENETSERRVSTVDPTNEPGGACAGSPWCHHVINSRDQIIRTSKWTHTHTAAKKKKKRKKNHRKENKAPDWLTEKRIRWHKRKRKPQSTNQAPIGEIKKRKEKETDPNDGHFGWRESGANSLGMFGYQKGLLSNRIQGIWGPDRS